MIGHVHPVNDIREHELETTCHCDPVIKFEDGNMMVIHNSYDLREWEEEGSKGLKGKPWKTEIIEDRSQSS